MNRFKFQAFYEEFPFLTECNQKGPHHCDGIEIKRATLTLMSYVPAYSGATGSLVSIDYGERFDFILSDGSVIIDAVKDGGHCRHNEAHTDDESWSGETILEAIDRHKVANTLSFIVKTEYGYRIRDHRSGPEYGIAIFKPSREFTWGKLTKDAKQKALTEVQAEAKF